jgi:hypothetical protein
MAVFHFYQVPRYFSTTQPFAITNSASETMVNRKSLRRSNHLTVQRLNHSAHEDKTISPELSTVSCRAILGRRLSDCFSSTGAHSQGTPK